MYREHAMDLAKISLVFLLISCGSDRSTSDYEVKYEHEDRPETTLPTPTPLVWEESDGVVHIIEEAEMAGVAAEPDTEEIEEAPPSTGRIGNPCTPFVGDCSYRFTSPYTEGPRDLRCRIHYLSPGNSRGAPAQQVEFFTNCGTCKQAALAALEMNSHPSGPISTVSGKTCSFSKLIDNETHPQRFSFRVLTQSGSSCQLPTEKFSFQSSLFGSENDSSETDGCN